MKPDSSATKATPAGPPQTPDPPPNAVTAYAATFVARLSGMGETTRGVPGLHGVTLADDPSSVRLLVTDDRASDGLATLLPTVRSGRIAVFAEAARCTRLVTDHLGWASAMTTSMTCLDLQAVPELALPSDLTLQQVQEGPEGVPGGVTLEQAVAVAALADPGGVEDPGVLARGLRSSMPAFRFFAAVDLEGVVRGTSGVGVFGPRAVVILVNTDPGWRRRGLGRAMTAAALRAARACGASHASLDASTTGLSIYQQLGFDVIAQNMRFASTT